MKETCLLQLSDLHLGSDARLGGDPDGVVLRAVLAELVERRLRIDACVITGDLVHDGNSDAYARLRQILNSCPWPVRVVPGNHDDVDIGAPIVGADYWPPGECWDLRVGNDVTLIGLNSAVKGFNHGELGDVCLSRAEKLMQAAAERGAWLVALHHPPIDIGHWWMDAQGLLRGREQLLRLAESYGAAAILCGHVHMCVNSRRVGAPPVIIAPSIGYEVVYDDADERPLRFRKGGPRGLLHRMDHTGITTVELTCVENAWLAEGLPWSEEVFRTNRRLPAKRE